MISTACAVFAIVAFNLTVPQAHNAGLMTLLPLALACVIQRPARSAGYPYPVQARTVPPGRLHSSTGLPYLIGGLLQDRACAPTGLLRGLPGVSFGRPFRPSREFLWRSLSTSRFLRSGMGLSDNHSLRRPTITRRSRREQVTRVQLSRLGSGLPATPKSLWRLRTPWAAFSATRFTPCQSTGIAARAFLDYGPAMVSTVAHRIPHRRLPPRGSAVSSVSLLTLLSIRYRLASLRRRAQVCTLPLSHSGWVSAPRSPPRLHRAPIPFS
jgi:hypothetical protein